MEGDFDYMGLKRSNMGVGTGFLAPFLSTSDSIRTSWLSTVRGRVGYAVPDGWLLFATGGLAMTEARFTMHEQSAFAGFLIESTDGSHSRVMTGWTVGGGVEKAFGPWTLKAEYLYADFGRISAGGPTLSLGTIPEGVNYSVSAHLTAQILRAGFTYRFWGP